MRLRWTRGRLQELDPLDVYDLLALRSEVFVVEQTCIFQDADGVDKQAHHLLGRDARGLLRAGLRIVDPGVKYPEPSIGRVITAPTVRRSGVGRELMGQGIQYCRDLWPRHGVRISAQARLERFYRDFGFQIVSDPYLEDDIPHVEMLLDPEHAL
ncbi:MAG: GNAT family N-acetyltransferase [Betaproteobacteria bacterium]|nr:GNAT family N-acetyltransferase [Betaproteobacteria bacterium]